MTPKKQHLNNLDCSRYKMHVDFMRKADYWLGIPICFFLSMINKTQKILGFGKLKEIKPKKVLFIELSEMGSAIIAYTSMKKIKELFPNSNIFFLIFEEYRYSVDILNLIPKENVITVRSKSFFLFVVDMLRALWKIRKEKIDTAVDLELFSRVSNIISYLSGANIRVGFYNFYSEGLYRGTFQTHKVSYNPYYHIGMNYMHLVYALIAQNNETPLLKKKIEKHEIKLPKILSSKTDKDKIWQKLKNLNHEIDEKKKIVILNPNASQRLPLRKWPLTYYVGLAKKLLNDKDIVIVITGILSEKKDAQFICNSVENKRCIDLTGKTTLKELIDLYNISKVMVSNDSGPPHFASLTNIDIIVLFGPETPTLYAPLSHNTKVIYSNFACSPCVSAFNHRKSPCKDNKCLQFIKIDEVFDIIRNILY
jgi:ADP-heptose:LPS heptosyltransferase